jgi:hypothetical protein
MRGAERGTRQIALAVLAVFLAGGVVEGVVRGWPGWAWPPGAGVAVLAGPLAMGAIALLAGASERAVRRTWCGVAGGIVAVGLLGWPGGASPFILGLRVGLALGLLALVPRAWIGSRPGRR